MKLAVPPDAPRRSRAPVVRYVLILCVGLVAIALFLLATASANTALFAERYPAAPRR